MNTDRPIPFEKAAEAQVLGSMILSPDVIADIRDLLTPEMFFDPAHQTIYEVFCLMSDNSISIDLATASQELKRRGLLDTIGQGADNRAGQDYLVDLVKGTPDPSNAEYHAKRVKVAATKRDLIRLSNTLGDNACEADVEVKELLETYQQGVFSIFAGATDPSPMISASEAVEQAHARNEAVRKGEIPPGLMTGFEAIDSPIGGLQRGDFVILAADTARGKSSLALNMAFNMAEEGGTVLFVSAEMESVENGNRLLASLSGVDGGRLRAGGYGEDAYNEIMVAKALPALSRLHFVSRSSTVGEIVSKARDLIMKSGGPLAAIFVDYLQLMTPEDLKASKAVQIGGLAWGLKKAAMELRTPIIALSQLSREHSKANRPPALHDLKESGDIENAANVVLFLWHHPDQGDDTDGTQVVYVKVAKCRNGRTTVWPRPGEQVPGAISLRFKPHLTRFETRSIPPQERTNHGEQMD